MKMIRIESVKYKGSYIEYHHVGSRVRIFVSLEKKVAEALNREPRTEIAPYDIQGKAVPWKELKEQGLKQLKTLYTKYRNIPTLTQPITVPNRIAVVQPVPSTTAEGILVYAGPRPGLPFVVELVDEEGVLRRVEGLSLVESLYESGAGVGDEIAISVTTTSVGQEVVVEGDDDAIPLTPKAIEVLSVSKNDELALRH